MNQSNEISYLLLLNQIQALWNEEFNQKLDLGKYSKWALNLTPSKLISMLSAIGLYGRLSPQYPDIDTIQMLDDRQGLDELLGIKLTLNQEQQQALSFLEKLFSTYRVAEFTIPFEYSKESPHFVDNVNWAMNLTHSDLFGVIWHVGGFGIRNRYKGTMNSINDYHPRAQECLICMMRVAQREATYYRLGGKRFPLREQPII
jgi:hypothetical protein